MEPTYFLFLILPLGILVFVLVGVTIYYARKQEDSYEQQIKKLRKLLISGKIDTKTFTKLKNKTDYVKHFNGESKRLVELLSSGKIDEDTYNRLNQVLENSFNEKINKLEEDTKEPEKNPFNAAKF
ncbi:MAG: hypothetical protein P8X87_02045 [Candidatus Bathyarchaeota archaeon]|jgi:ribosomal protein L19E